MITASSRRWFGTRRRSRQLLDQRHARVFVSVVRGQHVGGRRRLAEIVHEHGETHGHAAAQLHRLAQRQQLVDAGVDLRVPLRGLRHAEQRIDLRVDHLQRAALAQHADEHIGAGLAQRLFGFGPHAFGHQRSRFAVGDHLPHERQGFVGHAEAQRRITRGEPRHAQDAHRIFDEGLGHVAQQARREIGLAAVRDR